VGKNREFKRRLIQVAVASCFATAAHANPTAPSVVSGAATFNAVGKNLTVTNSPGAIINWQGFSIRPDEVTRFVQSGAASAVLNRVTGPEHSQLLGQLLSNGRVFLINPNGVTVGAGARIDTAGFVASSLALSNEDFLAGKFRFTDPGNAGSVTNAGTINAHSGGPVYLVAPTVENHGVITAPNGDVMLAAGKSVELVSAASPHLRVEVQAGGEALNLGRLVAESGRVGLYGAAIRNSGLVSADSAQVTAAGTVVLKASKDVTLDATSVVTANGAQGGSVHVQAESGTLLADGRIEAKGAAAAGGEVKLLGTQVGLVNQAAVDASGAAGGGTVNVGGSRQGEGPLPNSRAVFVGADTRVAANATVAGDGGTVIVYADGAARIHGALEAKGGPQGGNGGFVETSGKQFLDVTRLPDVAAPAGSGGLWLIDPYDITVTTTAGQCNNLTGCVAGPSWTSSGAPAQLGVNLINNALNLGTSVTITTGAGGAGAGNVTFANNAAVSKTGGGNAALTVNATNNITFNNGANITATAGQLAVNLNAGAGGITSLRAVNTNGGTLTLDSGGAMTQAGVISGAGALVKNGTGTLTLSQNNTYTGATRINAGTLALSANNRIADTSAVTVAVGATFNLANRTETVGSIAGAGDITLGSGTLAAGANNTSTTFSGAISGTGGLTKQGTGTLTLSGTNTHTGTTTVSGGRLRLAGGSAIADTGTVSLANTAGVTLDLNGTSETIGALTGGGATGGNVTLGAGTLTTGNAAAQTYAGVISGSGGLTKQGTGTFTLSRANTYSGATTINAGTLALGANNVLSNATAVTIAAGATFSVNSRTDTVGSIAGAGNITTTAGGVLTTGNSGASTTYSGVMSGAGGLTKIGAGTLTLSGANTYTGATTVNGGTLLLGAADRIANGSAVTVGALGTFDLNGFNETVGSIAGTGGVTLGAGTLTAGGNNANTAYSGVMSGSGGLTKAGTGTLTISGANTYTGATTINAGTLTLGANNVLADTTAVTVGGGATFSVNSRTDTVGSIAGAGNITTAAAGVLTSGGDGGSTTYSGVMSGAGALTKIGAGTLTLSGANTYTGATTVNGGTLRLGAANRIANASAVDVAAGATFDLNDFSDTVGTIAGAGSITLGSGTLTAGNATSTTFSGVISGAGGFTKAGTGTIELSGANTYAGATLVSAGTLVASNASSLGTTAGATTVANNAALNVAGVSIGETLTLSGTGVGATGALRGSGAAAVTGPVTLAANSSIGADAGATLTVSGAIGQAGGNRTLTKVGAGTLVVSGANTYAGATTISAGTLTAAGGSAIPNGSAVTIANAAGARLDLAASETIGNLSGGGATGGNITLNANTLTVNETGATTYAGVISGTGGLTKAGAAALTLSGANTYTGPTTISAGTLTLGANNVLADTTAVTVAGGATFSVNTRTDTVGSLAGAGNITTAAGGVLTTGGDGTSTTYSGVMSGAGSLVKIGAGTQTLSGASTYTGTTAINGGALAIGADNNLGAAPGAATANKLIFNGGTLQTRATFTLNANRGVTLNAGGGTFDANAGTTLTYGGIAAGAGSLTKAGAGTLILSGNNAYGGATTINAGTLTAAGGNAIPNGSQVTLADVAGATLNLAAAETIGNLAGGGALGGNVALGANTLTVNQTGTTTYAGAIGGTGGVTKAGAGTLELSGASAYSGATNVNVGTLVASNAAALGATGSGTTVAGGATLNVNNVAIGAENVTINGNGVGGAGALTGTGTASLGGAVTVASASRVGAAAGSTLALNGAVDGANALDVDGGGTVTFGSAVGNTTPLASLTSAAGTTLNVNGGLVRTTGTQTYGGPVTTGGPATLQTTNSAITANGAVTATAGTLTLDTGTGSATMTNAANDFATVAIPAAGGVSLVDQNGLALGASNVTSLQARTLAGDLTVNAALTATGGGTSIVLAAAGNFVNNAGAAALNPGAGRWLVYSTDPAANTFGGLASGNQALWGRTHPAAVPEPGNRYVFTTQPTITFTSTDIAKTYGQDATAAVAAAYVVSGFVDAALYGNVFTQDTAANALSGSPAVTSLGSPATASVAGSPYAINVNTAGVTSPTGYAIAGNSAGRLTIGAAALTVTANNQTKPYGNTFVFAGTEFTPTGLQNGETIGTVALASAGAAPTATVPGSPYPITAANATGGTFNPANYIITYANGVMTVTPLPIVVTANDQTKVYGQPDPALTFTAPTVNGDVLNGSLTRAPGETVPGSPYAITQGTVTNANNPNYAITFVNGQLVITPAPLTIAADNKTRAYGDPNPALTATFTGLTNGDTPAAIPGVTLTTPATIASNVGNYAINVASGANPNYTIAYVNGQLAITPAPLTIAANDASRRFGTPNPPFTATSTGFKLGQTVGDLAGTLVFTTPATLLSPPGSYVVTPGGVSSANYTITFVNGRLVVEATAPPADHALVTAVDRSESDPTGGLRAAPRAAECLTLERPGERRVLGRCFF